MTKVSLEAIKALREKTHAPMSDCKEALEAVGGDIERAVDELRKKGVALMLKRGGKEASEGLVGAYAVGNKGVLVEVRTETDFVARNEIFQKFVDDLTKLAFDQDIGSVESLLATSYGDGDVQAALADLVGSMRENITLGRVESIVVESGSVGAYVHDKTSKLAGRIGVLVAVSSSSSKQDELADLVRKLAMHVAANKPVFCFDTDVDKDSLERERALAEERAQGSGKPANIVAKMIEGRMAAYMDTVVFARQSYLFDTSKSVADAIAAMKDSLGADAHLASFVSLAIKEV